MPDTDHVVIDCATCVARSTPACDDCLVTAVLGPHPGRVELAGDEVRAVAELQLAGLVPLSRYRRDGAA